MEVLLILLLVFFLGFCIGGGYGYSLGQKSKDKFN